MSIVCNLLNYKPLALFKELATETVRLYQEIWSKLPQDMLIANSCETMHDIQSGRYQIGDYTVTPEHLVTAGTAAYTVLKVLCLVKTRTPNN